MAIWKEQSSPTKETAVLPAESLTKKEPEPARVEFSPPSYGVPRRTPERDARESVIGAELTIEGKIEGSGHVRIAGRFKGDVHVQGNLSIDPGATLTGGVRADVVIVGGQLEGNIDSATRVELLETGVLTGDLSAKSLTVAAGSRMRGRVEFGWDDKSMKASPVRDKSGGSTMKVESGSAA